jgi:aryl-alcohol dehydrogenase-like predicted oxidoreductase
MQLQKLDERNRAIAQGVNAIASKLGVRSSQLALAWVMARDVIPIVGATQVNQMRENMKAASLLLPPDVLGELDALSAFDLGHPYSMLKWDMSMSLGYGGMFDQLDIPRFPSRLR